MKEKSQFGLRPKLSLQTGEMNVHKKKKTAMPQDFSIFNTEDDDYLNPRARKRKSKVRTKRDKSHGSFSKKHSKR
jgi:hypothetical protein